jgi:hypothetical protein
MTIIVKPTNEYRVIEKDGHFVQFFDKKKQITNEDLETIDVLDETKKPIYDLYVEIYNKEDPHSIVCKKVNGNKMTITVNNIRKHFDYQVMYPKAFEVYNKRKNENLENDANAEDILKKDAQIESLTAELEKLKKLNEKKEAKEVKASKFSKEENIKENNLE